MNEVWYPRNTQRELYVKTGSLLESSKCGRRGGSNVKATTDKFDSMRAFSEEVVKSPLLLFTESHKYSSSTCSSVFLVTCLFSVLGGGLPYMDSAYEDVSVCFYCLSLRIIKVEIV